MNRDNLRKLLTASHLRKAKALGCRIYNLAWVLTGDAICSKTTKGYLTTERVGARLYNHRLDQYERV